MIVVPGPQVKNWPQYEALRKKGHSKESAARIANSGAKKKRKRKRHGVREIVGGRR